MRPGGTLQCNLDLRSSPLEPERSRFFRELGKAIAASRKDAGLTQEELAERLPFCQPTLSRIERGKGRCNVWQGRELGIELGIVWTDWIEIAWEEASRTPVPSPRRARRME